MMDVASLATLIATLALGTVSPGPSFIMIAQTSVARSRAHGVSAGIGIGMGGVCFAAAALAGLHAVMLKVPVVYVALKVLGGLYLCWLGARIFLSARQSLPLSSRLDAEAGSLPKALLMGLATQLSNPKAAIVYAGVFAALLPQAFGISFAVAVLLAVFAIEAGWYVFVAYALSSERPRNVYLRCKAMVDRTAGVVLVALGIKLLISEARAWQ